MRVTYRIPTKDQYAFVEVEDDRDLTTQEIADTYNGLKETINAPSGEGIGLKALAKVIHEYCTTGGIVNGGEYDFSEKEKLLLAEIKKIVRLNK